MLTYVYITKDEQCRQENGSSDGFAWVQPSALKKSQLKLGKILLNPVL